jgi:hypothetical protein
VSAMAKFLPSRPQHDTEEDETAFERLARAVQDCLRWGTNYEMMAKCEDDYEWLIPQRVLP